MRRSFVAHFWDWAWRAKRRGPFTTLAAWHLACCQWGPGPLISRAGPSDAIELRLQRELMTLDLEQSSSKEPAMQFSPTHGALNNQGNLIPCFPFQVPLFIFVKILINQVPRQNRADQVVSRHLGPTCIMVSQLKSTSYHQKSAYFQKFRSL
jgi:hypothetical protein